MKNILLLVFLLAAGTAFSQTAPAMDDLSPTTIPPVHLFREERSRSDPNPEEKSREELAKEELAKEEFDSEEISDLDPDADSETDTEPDTEALTEIEEGSEDPSLTEERILPSMSHLFPHIPADLDVPPPTEPAKPSAVKKDPTKTDTIEFPQWAKDLRRGEIIAFGAFPIVVFFSRIIMDLYRMSQHDWDRKYAPWPATAPGAVGLTENEIKTLFTIAGSISVAVAVADHFIIRHKRKKAAAPAMPAAAAPSAVPAAEVESTEATEDAETAEDVTTEDAETEDTEAEDAEAEDTEIEDVEVEDIEAEVEEAE